MTIFKILEEGRLSEVEMSEIVGGKTIYAPCTGYYENCNVEIKWAAQGPGTYVFPDGSVVVVGPSCTVFGTNTGGNGNGGGPGGGNLGCVTKYLEEAYT